MFFPISSRPPKGIIFNFPFLNPKSYSESTFIFDLLFVVLFGFDCDFSSASTALLF